jgi:hypothetical protein
MKYLILLLLIPYICSFSQNQTITPVVKTIEGRRAFDDLQKLYKDKTEPDFKSAFDRLNSSNNETQKSAAAYIYALYVQTFDDEKNGRTSWEKMPFFNETWESPANNFRKRLTWYFADHANSPLLLTSAEWLIFNDYEIKHELEGIKFACKLKSPESNKILEKIIKKPEINNEVVAQAIIEAADRDLTYLNSDIEKLQNHYSSKIRNAVRDNASKLNLNIEKFDPQSAITPWLEEQFFKMYDMILDKVPPNAKFVKIETRKKYDNEEYVYHYAGWLLDEDSLKYHLLDCSGQNYYITKEIADLKETTLEKVYTDAINNKGIWDNESFNDRSSVSMYEGQSYVQKFTIAAWCYNYGLKKEAASIILPVIDEAGNDSLFTLIMRDSFGHLYHIEMLIYFSNRLDYDKSLEYAEHLSKPLFEGYIYQKRAIELADQIRRRKSDFITFVLPNKNTWDSLTLKLNRKDQIIYLADRIRLLNCLQYSQPGDISYKDDQHAKISDEQYKLLYEKKLKYEEFKVINPYNEILKMNLSIGELKYLIPYITDENYIPSYSYWRNFHYARNLHKVNYVVADLIFKISHKDLADLNNFEKLDNSAKQKKVDSLIKWCDDNANIKNSDLILDILKTTKVWKEFQSAMNYGLKDSVYTMIPILIKRLNDFPVKYEWPSPQGKIANVVFQLSSKDQLETARQWQSTTDQWVQLFSSLILLKFGDIEKLEGLKVLKSVLDSCDGTTWYPDALPVLIEIHKPETMELANGILIKRGFKDKFYWGYYSILLRKLVLAGSDKALKFMIDGLENTTKDEGWSAVNKNKILLHSENYAETASSWHIDNYEYSMEYPVEKKIKLCKELSKWVQEQFNLIKEGKPHQIKTTFEKIVRPVESIDAP